MLVKLSVQNYALIRELNVEFEKGLTIITGETGAGKSILLGALGLILGARADASVLLNTDEKCVVEGTFNIEKYNLRDLFESGNLDYENETVVRREINSAGKSRAFVNDTPVNLNMLRELAGKLIDIHSQHQTLMLNDNSFQLNVIDSFAGTIKLKTEFAGAYSTLLKLRRELDEAREEAGKNKADLEYFIFQLQQLEAAKLIPGEQEQLETEQSVLAHAEEIRIALDRAVELFRKDESSILSMLKEVKLCLSKAGRHMPGGEELLGRASSSLIELDDIADEIERLGSGIEADPRRLAFVSERLDTIWSLIQKHRVSNLEDLIAKREEIREKVRSAETGDEKVAGLQKQLDTHHAHAAAIARALSEQRQSVVREIEEKISELLKQLGMPNARFRISLDTTESLSASGFDQADFMFTANRQVPPENIAKIASGGELSRVMLSLKSLLTKYTDLPTIIFDEIDSGVSGEIADMVGRILSGMGRYMQVINITHLPQVASRGSRHYHVYKDDVNGSTVTRVKLLSAEERIIEVARLLSGSEVTEAAIRNARELLGSAMN